MSVCVLVSGIVYRLIVCSYLCFGGVCVCMPCADKTITDILLHAGGESGSLVGREREREHAILAMYEYVSVYPFHAFNSCVFHIAHRTIYD